eukprot:m.204413 g.204413  ORF g.204413 m.204413 type:complete len:456 (-) comp26027_c1_seq2:45-1412(-)
MTLMMMLLLGCIAATSADTPANCTNTQALGRWTFSVSPNSYTKDVNCSTFAHMPKTSMTITLRAPDVAVDDQGNTGFWTFIYNQGFEVVVNNKKYFAFSNYTTVGKVTTSHCESTLPGWFHDADGKNWGCFVGNQLSHETTATTQKAPASPQPAGMWRSDPELVNHINKHHSWQAKDYHFLQELPLATVKKISGSSPAEFPKSQNSKYDGLTDAEKYGDLPESFDWRNVDGVNYVSPVRDQESCGSCYSFGSTAALEARVRINSNNTEKTVFSPQDVVSCSEYSQGCAGGFPYLVYKYGQDFGLVNESCFPYTGKDPSMGGPTCNRECPSPKRYFVKSYEYIGGYYGACNEVDMMKEIHANGPVAIGFQVNSDFMHYAGGVYDGCTNPPKHSGVNFFETTNHAVAVVGWGVDGGKKYWIVKNSWSDKWGLEGYFMIARGQDECACESMAASAVLE